MHDTQESALLAEVRERGERHLRSVAASDQQALMSDLAPDRWKQIVTSLRLPAPVTATEVVDVRIGDSGLPETVLRYTGEDGEVRDVRSRWKRHEDGSLRIIAARNLPVQRPLPVEFAAADSLAAEHFAGMNRGQLMIQRCASCRRWIWGPRRLCPSCRSFDLHYEQVPAEGRIYSWTRTTQPFHPGVAGNVPNVIVLAELPHAGNVRVLGLLIDDESRDPVIGEQVIARYEEVAPGHQMLRWQLTGQSTKAEHPTKAERTEQAEQIQETQQAGLSRVEGGAE
ncbi:hypothetical protein GCM10022261_01770 [Brevibacterium daeguense]|uniref:DUF35 domain-containing protein n=1 Tax=Brevibacterium daeguense TaxID=909936 RepID=A0ABP8EFK1_9MICO|nr:zinc ribbon domain-containing protein [Brevibacterium daeguense]